MVNKLSPKLVSFSLAIVSAIISLFCALLLAVFPQGTLNFFGSIFHGVDLSQIQTQVTFSGVLMGLVAIIIVALVSGYIFTLTYNLLLKKLK